MRSFGVRLPILAATAWAGIGLSVLGGDLGYSETVYISPTVATFAWPTSYVTSDTYVLPTTYSFASYIPAAYVEEPVTLASTDLPHDRLPGPKGALGPAPAGRTTCGRQLRHHVLSPSSYVVPTLLHNLLPGNKLYTNHLHTDRVRLSASVANPRTSGRARRIATRCPATRR